MKSETFCSLNGGKRAELKRIRMKMLKMKSLKKKNASHKLCRNINCIDSPARTISWLFGALHCVYFAPNTQPLVPMSSCDKQLKNATMYIIDVIV